MLRKIIPIAERILITSFFSTDSNLKNLSESPLTVANLLEKLGFERYKIYNGPKDALNEFYKSHEKYLVVTGSLYLASEIYKLIL